MAAIHEVNKPFKFNICEPIFSQKRNFCKKGKLNEHISAIHEVIQSLPKKGDRMDILVQFIKERTFQLQDL